MPKILFLKGLPASGKSTFARELVASKPDMWVRVNKDDFRKMLHDGKWSRGREKIVEHTQMAVAKDALARGKSVIVDNTHLSPRHENEWRQLADETGSEFTVHAFDPGIDICLKRDQERGAVSGCVGKDVILRMFYQHCCSKPPEHNPDLPNAIICDIDGTLAKMNGRSPYEWDKVGSDELVEPVARIIAGFVHSNTQVLLVSGRDGSCEVKTRDWLQGKGVDYDQLWMRPAGSMAPDTNIKHEIYLRHIKGRYNVIGVFDDRPCVVRLWRALGLFVFDVGNGIEF